MTHGTELRSKVRKFAYGSVIIATLLLAVLTLSIFATDKSLKVGTIDATAIGTSELEMDHLNCLTGGVCTR
jgi:hypothetical protein